MVFVKKKLSYITLFLFLSLLLLPLISMLFLQGAQWYLKWKAAERMEEKILIEISLPLSNVRWEKKEKELNIGGRLFDVKFYQLAGNRLIAKGFYDEVENSVVKLLSSLPHDKKNNSLLHFFLVLQCFSAGVEVYSIYHLLLSTILLFSFGPFFLPQQVLLVLEQPPRYRHSLP